MTALVAVAAVAALIWLLVALEKRAGGTVSWQEPVAADASWARVGRAMSVGEAEVALRLLESNGIRVRRETRGPGLPGSAYRAGGETRYDLLVAPGDADDARALLGGV
ncbi:MAG TPA: hypothetical protein VGX28_14780 [Frankiaceae bacterium]|nr:hypothetical protein [Frankiaceae bacterium]